MKVPEQRESVFKLCHGDEKEVMGQAEQFMKWLLDTNLWKVEEIKVGNCFIIYECLHQQYGKVLVAGDNLSVSLIRRNC